MSLPDRMRKAQDHAGLSNAEIARRMGVSPQAVNGWYKTGTIQKRNLVRFAKETGADLGHLMGGGESTVEEEAASYRTPTAMGRRILDFMKANGSPTSAEVAETIGLTPERFDEWLYTEVSDIEAAPLLRAADALSTNAEYLLGIADDPRPLRHLHWREMQLMDAFRDLSPEQQDLLLMTATAWHNQAATAPSASAPFRVPVPANGEKTDG